MQELKNKIIKLRKFMNTKQFMTGSERELKAKEIVFLKEAHEAIIEWDNKEEAALFWNNQFTGNYDG